MQTLLFDTLLVSPLVTEGWHVFLDGALQSSGLSMLQLAKVKVICCTTLTYSFCC